MVMMRRRSSIHFVSVCIVVVVVRNRRNRSGENNLVTNPLIG